MVKIENRTFDRQVINFEDTQYVRCTFTRCQLVFTGLTIPNMVDCDLMGDCAWTFAGAATNTFNFLNILYNSGSVGVTLVESILQMIRSGSPFEPAAGSLPVEPSGVN